MNSKHKLREILNVAFMQCDYWVDDIESVNIDAEPIDCLLQGGVVRIKTNGEKYLIDIYSILEAIPQVEDYKTNPEQLLQYVVFGYVRW